MLHTLMLFGTFGVVEALQSTYEIAGDPADPFKFRFMFGFVAAAAGTDVTDDSVVAADRIAINGVID